MNDVEIDVPIELRCARRGLPLPAVVIPVKTRSGELGIHRVVHLEVDAFEMDSVGVPVFVERVAHTRNRGAIGEYPHFVTTGGGEQGSESDLQFRPLPRVTRQSRQQNLHWTNPPLPFDRSPASRAKNTFRSARAVIRDRIGSPVNLDGLRLRAAPATPRFGKPRSAGRQSSSR